MPQKVRLEESSEVHKIKANYREGVLSHQFEEEYFLPSDANKLVTINKKSLEDYIQFDPNEKKYALGGIGAELYLMSEDSGNKTRVNEEVLDNNKEPYHQLENYDRSHGYAFMATSVIQEGASLPLYDGPQKLGLLISVEDSEIMSASIDDVNSKSYVTTTKDGQTVAIFQRLHPPEGGPRYLIIADDQAVLDEIREGGQRKLEEIFDNPKNPELFIDLELSELKTFKEAKELGEKDLASILKTIKQGQKEGQQWTEVNVNAKIESVLATVIYKGDDRKRQDAPSDKELEDNDAKVIDALLVREYIKQTFPEQTKDVFLPIMEYSPKTDLQVVDVLSVIKRVKGREDSKFTKDNRQLISELEKKYISSAEQKGYDISIKNPLENLDFGKLKDFISFKASPRSVHEIKPDSPVSPGNNNKDTPQIK